MPLWVYDIAQVLLDFVLIGIFFVVIAWLMHDKPMTAHKYLAVFFMGFFFSMVISTAASIAGKSFGKGFKKTPIPVEVTVKDK